MKFEYERTDLTITEFDIEDEITTSASPVVPRPCFVLAVFERVTNAAVYFWRELWKKSRDSGSLS